MRQPIWQERKRIQQNLIVKGREDVFEILDDPGAKKRPDQRARTAKNGDQDNFAPASGSVTASNEPANPAYMPEITKAVIK